MGGWPVTESNPIRWLIVAKLEQAQKLTVQLHQVICSQRHQQGLLGTLRGSSYPGNVSYSTSFRF